MTSHQHTLQQIQQQIQQEIALVEQRLKLSTNAVKNYSLSSNGNLPPATSTKFNKNDQFLEEEQRTKQIEKDVSEQIEHLYSLFSSRSVSQVQDNNDNAHQRTNSPLPPVSATNNTTSSTAGGISKSANPFLRQRKASPIPNVDGDATNSATPTASVDNNNNNTNNSQQPQSTRGNSPTPTFSTSHANQFGGAAAAAVTPTTRSGTPPPPSGGTTTGGLRDYNSNNNNNTSGNESPANLSRASSNVSSILGTPTSRSGSPSNANNIPRPPPPPPKSGMLLNYGLPAFMRSFKSTYVVVGTDSVKWYKSEESLKAGDKEIGSVPLWSVLKNSRGSVIKQTAAGWPYITVEECSKATDATKHYFGIQYFDQKESLAFLILAANSLEEKKEWVHHIAQLIPLQLPPDAPRLPGGDFYVDLATNVLSHHCKKVLDGEAPKF